MTRAPVAGVLALFAVVRAARGAAARAAAVALALAGCASGVTLDAVRAKDLECVDARGADLAAKNPHSWIVVEHGEVTAISPAADDAVRAAQAQRAAAPRPASGAPHRFVFRPRDRGDRLYRLAFLPEGGIVAGRQFLEALGFRVTSVGTGGPGRTLVLDHHGSRRTMDLAERPRVRIDLTPLGGGPVTSVDVPLDPDFDGPVLLSDALARGLDLDRAEIPGAAEVQVALGRPFNARRAFASAKCPDLSASAAVEILTPAAPPPSRR